MHRPVITVRPSMLASEALRMMERLGLRDVIVEPVRPSQPYSLLNAQDVQARISRQAGSSEPLVRDVMTTPSLYVAPEMRLEDCTTLLLSARVRRTLVMSEGKPVGIISDNDIFQAIESR
jgi:CBS domain-containing protein